MQEQFTHKSQEALQNAQQAATSAGHPELTPLHLARALLAEPEGVTSAVLQKLDVDPKVLTATLDRELERLPRSSGGQLAMSRAMNDVMVEASAAAKKLGDTYVSTEHMLLALTKKGGPEVMGLFAARNIRPERVEAALTEARHGKKVTSPDPEAT